MNKDLSTRVAELFSPKPWKHDISTLWAGDPPMKDPPKTCTKCESFDLDQPCHVPDPIDITDLGKALECYRGLKNMSKVRYYKTCRQVYPHQVLADENNLEQMACFKEWLLEEATAEQIWEICCLAKETEAI